MAAPRATGVESRRLAVAYSESVRIAKELATAPEVVALVAQHRTPEAVALLRRAFDRLGSEYAISFQRGALVVAPVLQRAYGAAFVAFDSADAEAIVALRAARDAVIDRVMLSVGEAARSAVVRARLDGLNDKEVHAAFVRSIGLPQTLEQASTTYEELLRRGSSEARTRTLRDRRFDRRLARASASAEPPSEVEVRRMAEAYRRRALASQARTVGLTVAQGAVHAGAEAAAYQAIRDAQLQPSLASGDVGSAIERTWVTRHDIKVRHAHNAVDGQSRPLGGTWPGLDGPMRFPGDPKASARDAINCRCYLRWGISNTKLDILF